MRLLHVITGLSIGGAERALYSVLAGGLAARFDTAVLSLRDQGSLGTAIRQLGLPVHTLDMGGGVPGARVLARLRRIVRSMAPDVIQGWMYHGNLAASVAARMTPGPRPAVAWNVRHSLYSLAAEKPLTRQVIRANRWASVGADAILYNSRLSREQHEAFGFASKCGQVIPNGFDTGALRPDAVAGEATRKALAIPQDAIVIGHVARFHPMKDHASFLRAAVEVMRQRADVVCLMAGREVNLENPALAGIVPQDLEGRFFFVGERGDVPELMQAMDVFCQSSWSEAFPNVLGEAMALGVPCVVTDVGDSRDIVGETGEVVPPSDSAALAQGLLAMLDQPARERAALGQAARARIEARYALSRLVEQYRGLYEQLRPEA